MDRVVPFGKMPYVCLCCKYEAKLYKTAAWVGGEGSELQETIQESGQCACADFTGRQVISMTPAYCVAVTCEQKNYGWIADLYIKASRQNEFQGRHTFLKEGLYDYVITKAQLGWNFLYAKEAEDHFSVLIATQASTGAWVPTWQELQHSTTASAAVTACTWPPSLHQLQQMRQGLIPRMVAWLSTAGGLLSMITLVFTGIFVKKNSSHVMARMFNERTLRSAPWRSQPEPGLDNLLQAEVVAPSQTPTTLGHQSPNASSFPRFPPGIVQQGVTVSQQSQPTASE